MATAYANTEYQTHYLNLAYTPSKAISLLVASKAFHSLPLGKSYGHYPADSTFDAFRASYNEQLSLMNTEKEFYYSNPVTTVPVNTQKLEHIAGVGRSSVVNYDGYGAYFMDKLESGVWRLEVMPDAISIRDPFEKPSLKKEVTRIQWEPEQMRITLPDLGDDYSITPLNTGNAYHPELTSGRFIIKPGVYLLARKDRKNVKWDTSSYMGAIKINEYNAPKPFDTSVYVVHKPFSDVTADKPFMLNARIVGVNINTKVVVMVHNSAGGRYQNIDMLRKSSYDYQAEIGREFLMQGLLSYKIVVQNSAGNFVAFPGNHPGNPVNWDNFNNEEWETYVSAEKTPLTLFDANIDRSEIDGAPFGTTFITSKTPHQLLVNISSGSGRRPGPREFGFHVYLTGKFNGRRDELDAFTNIVVKAKTQNSEPVKVKVSLVDDEGSAWSAFATVSNELRDIEIPINSLQRNSYMLWPRPYPEFLPASFKNDSDSKFKINRINMLEIIAGQDKTPDSSAQTYNLQVESVVLKK